MAEVTSMRNNVAPWPIYQFAWTIVFPIVDADGTLVTGATGLDSEVSINGDTFADCVNEAAEIGTSGMYSLQLTQNEMSGDIVTVITKTSTAGAKTARNVLYPAKGAFVQIGTAQGGGSYYITLEAGSSAVDKFYNGCFIRIYSGTGSGQGRFIYNYLADTLAAYVVQNWITNPSTDSLYEIIASPFTTNALLTVNSGKVSIYRPTGSVATHASNTASTFKTDLALTDDTYNRNWIKFTSGNLTGEISKVIDFVASTLFITVSPEFTEAPAAGDDFEIINE